MEGSEKQRYPGQFIIKCSIGQGKVDKAICDLGASINIMPLKNYEKLIIEPLTTADCMIRLADNSTIKAVGMIEDVLVKVDDFIFPPNFIIFDMKVDKNVPLILGRDFLARSKALIDVGKGEIKLRDNASKSTYKIESEVLKYEEVQRAKIEYECRVVMMIDTTKSKGPKEGDDCSNPSIFGINALPPASKKGKPNPPKVTSQGKQKGKKKKKA